MAFFVARNCSGQRWAQATEYTLVGPEMHTDHPTNFPVRAGRHITDQRHPAESNSRWWVSGAPCRARGSSRTGTRSQQPENVMAEWSALIKRVRDNGYNFNVLTPDEAASVWAATRENDYAHLLEGLVRQASKGERCSVCLMTPEQSKAAGYDCIREC